MEHFLKSPNIGLKNERALSKKDFVHYSCYITINKVFTFIIKAGGKTVGKSRISSELIDNFTSILKEKYVGICKKQLTSLILELIEFHKLEVRVASEKKINNDHINANYFDAQIKIANYKTLIGFRNHCKNLENIANEFRQRSIKEMPIIIKGVSVYHLTKNKRNIKRSGDIDLIYSDPSILELILIEMGFSKDGEVSDHEYSQMVKGNQVIDIHKYIPIINYSEGVINKAKKATNNNNRVFFESYTNMLTSKLRYEELSKNSFACEELGGLLLPNIEYQFLILCAHIFKNYVTSSFHISSGVILAELLDAYELSERITSQM